ncbi:MAG: TIGR01459 family HAD-type hydrolase [Hyphomicrobiales bacterium]|nr:TIGR01459 family HAD-type hydrolase [Hyphomicrobiales bacterium]
MTDRSFFLAGVGQIADRYDGILSDIWGVVHNGVAAWPSACEALTQFRAGGAAVVLISNAPRPSRAVTAQLHALGVPEDAYDAFVSSGDVTHDLLAREYGGARVFHLGPERDLSLYESLDVTLTGEAVADIIVCTGLFDDTTETPEDYDRLLRGLVARRLPFICANPDRVVERGTDLVYCAGALADLYRDLGGVPQVIGKPYAEIYDVAHAALTDALGRPLDNEKVLAIGDSVSTDLRGAADHGYDVLFVTGGIHGAELGPVDAPDPGRIAELLQREGLRPVGVQPRLVW